jgi:hypothetical protein
MLCNSGYTTIGGSRKLLPAVIVPALRSVGVELECVLVRAIVLHDKAPEMFHECTVDEKHELFTKLKASFPYAGSLPAHSTLFTRKQGRSSAVMRLDRPALLIRWLVW